MMDFYMIVMLIAGFAVLGTFLYGCGRIAEGSGGEGK